MGFKQKLIFEKNHFRDPVLTVPLTVYALGNKTYWHRKVSFVVGDTNFSISLLLSGSNKISRSLACKSKSKGIRVMPFISKGEGEARNFIKVSRLTLFHLLAQSATQSSKK